MPRNKYSDIEKMIEITDIVDLKAYVSTDPDYLQPTILLRITHKDYDGGFNVGPMLSENILKSLKNNGHEKIVIEIEEEFEKNKNG